MNRKMRINAAKAAKRKESRGESCDRCGGTKVGSVTIVNRETQEVVSQANVCEPPKREHMH